MSKSQQKQAFSLKAEFLPITTLRLNGTETDRFQTELENTIKKAPQYFAKAPVILDFTDIEDKKDEINVKELCDILKNFEIQPLAARGIEQSALPMLKVTSKKKEKGEEAEAVKTAEEKNKSKPTTLLITKPIRAGTQIYAKDADLIVMSSVNAGAEIIADGNIHVYGPLRGRALAGAMGNTQARIFCKELDAELVSIAGHYWVNEKIKSLPVKDKFVQIYLDSNGLLIKEI